MGASRVFAEQHHSGEAHFGCASFFQLIFNFGNDFKFGNALAQRSSTYFKCFISPIACLFHERNFFFGFDQAHVLKCCTYVVVESSCREMFPQRLHSLDSQKVLFDGPARQR
ncbi:hypothetical protein SDC9_191770 [bioreactor metagenome]|uniref:Uncharacterized protein n=1 Tax=bioreactor metagenome TaxID=1076179 RepID=A0A645I1A1_9ZZZZ